MTSLYQNNWVKKITLRFRVSKTLTRIRKFVIPYMAETKNYATVDLLSAAKISCIGFFSTLHPDLHNRDKIRRICETHVLATRQRSVDLSVLPRGITHGRLDEVAESRVIVVEVSTSDAQVVSDALMERQFFEYDADCRFIPFLKTKKTYSSTLAALIKKHDSLMESTQRLNIPDLFLEKEVKFIDGEFKTIKQVLLSTNNVDAPLIHDIDIAPNGSTNIMYYIERDSDLEAFVRGIPSLLAQYVHSEDVTKVYKNSVSIDKVMNQRRVTNNERKFWDEKEKSLETNPQDPEASSALVSTSSKSRSYAAAASASHTQFSSASRLPQDKRLLNMETSVSSIQKDYITKSDVEAMLKSHASQNTIPDSVIAPDTINSMIDAKIGTFSSTLSVSTSPMTEDQIKDLVDSTTKTSFLSLEHSDRVQKMIDKSIADLRSELSVTHEKLAKSLLAVNTTTANLSASITALQDQSKILSDLILENTSNPAISREKLTGAKAE